MEENDISQTMLDSLGFYATVTARVDVAGGIGNGINMKNAVTIGMFLDIPPGEFPLHRQLRPGGRLCHAGQQPGRGEDP